MRAKRIRILFSVSIAIIVSLFFAGALGAQTVDITPADKNITPPAGNGIKEAPLGSVPVTPSGTTTLAANSLDLQIAGNTNSTSTGMDAMEQSMGMDAMEKSMDMDMMNMASNTMINMSNMSNSNSMNNSGMMGMMGMMDGMGNMANTNNTNNMAAMNNNGPVLAQLQTSNAAILQLIASLSAQPSNANQQAQLNSLYQMLSIQNTLIQTVLTNSGNAATATNTNSMSNGNGMSGMGMM